VSKLHEAEMEKVRKEKRALD
jgi:hypothetical protein